jgi:hypothetical protein
MADQRADDRSDNKRSDEQILGGQQSQASEYGDQGDQTMTDQNEQDDGMSGQPIGGNDSNTGSGTTLSQGASFGTQSSSSESFIGSKDTASDPHVKESGSSPEPIRSSSSAAATEGSNFAAQGRGATDEEDPKEESRGEQA